MADFREDLHYPKFRWPHSGWWFTVFGAFLGLTVIVFPGLSLLNNYWQRLFICLLLILMPCGVILFLHLIRCIGIFTERSRRYGQLIKEITILERQLDAAQRSLTVFLQERQKRNAFEIAHCYTFDHRTFIALIKKKGKQPNVGADVTVVDQESGALMGEFRIQKITDQNPICELIGYIDALWLGYIKQHGTQHSEAPPEALAWVLPGATGEENEGTENANRR